MKRIVWYAFLVLFVLPGNINADSEKPDSFSIPGLKTITASVRETPPDWAVMQRHLITTMEKAAPVFLDKFTRRGGTLYNYGEWDDVYEMFYNWSFFYAAGADENILDYAIRQYNVITRQGTVLDSRRPSLPNWRVAEPSLYKEFTKSKDWFHISEGMTAFYDFGIADPTIPENIDRAKRFAGFYLNEDPEAQNYDFKYKIIRGAATGSNGPAEKHYDAGYNLRYGHASLYPLVKDQDTEWEKGQERREELIEIYNRIVTPCDVPVNLCATGLMTNAYLYTGDKKYKQWVLDYVDAWMKRIEENNGILPDNIGQTGKIGEYRNGQWWGGLYGWTGRYSNHMIFGSMSVASECAYLLSGDPRYLNLLRSQIDMLFENSLKTEEGLLLVPHKYGSDGWSDYRLMNIRDPAHLWHASQSREDLERINRIKEGSRFYTDENLKPAEPFDWSEEPSTGDRCAGRTEYARLMYYAGENPDWPLSVLSADYQEVLRRLEFMRNDTRDVYTLYSDDLHVNNPVLTKGLLQVTMGAPQTIYNGGLLRARVRYFDIDRVRPGMPEDVSALVEIIEANRTVVNIVNLSAIHTRRLIVQAGAFGEHEFGAVKYSIQPEDSDTNVKTLKINSKYFAVDLPPGTSVKLDIETHRFVNDPSYAFPWHGGFVPVK
ncbi:hypothetical protein ACFL50_03670 [Candidatus Latescibacterota bacterium]